MVRILLVAVLAFAAGSLVGSTWLAGDADDAPTLLRGGEARAPGPSGLVPERAGGGDPAGGQDGGASLRASASAGDGPVLQATGRENRPFRLRARRAWAMELLDEAYAEYRNKEGATVPEPLRGAAARAVLVHVRRSIYHFGGWLRGYVDERADLGALEGEPKFVLQARGNGSVALDTPSRYLKRYVHVSKEPLDLADPIPTGGRPEYYRETGVPPLDRVVLIERVEVVMRLGTDVVDTSRRRRGEGTLEIQIGGSRAFKRKGFGGRELRGELIGLEIFTPPHSLPDIDVSVRNAAVSLVAHGRYVTHGEAQKMRDKKFRWVQEGDDGLLGDEAVTLQVLADHGRGSTVRLDGSTYRIEGVGESSLWDDSLNLQRSRDSFAWFDNAGVVPDGHVYHVTRVDWRARLDPKKNSRSNFVVKCNGKTLVARKASDGVDVSGTWEGEIDIPSGGERRFELTCSRFVMGEAVVYGTVIAPKK